jgi:two-component system, LytTR family, response regulator LytT
MQIKVLIIEDEKPAQDYLASLILQLEPDANILAKLASIESSVKWLKKNTADLIFMDIQLTDGLSFSIFEQIDVQTPVIFTTAFDTYAIKAFKVNSIDYLLKPIDEDDLMNSLDKFKKLSANGFKPEFESLLQALQHPKTTYQQRFMVHRGERLMSVTTDQIAYFEGEDRYVYLIKKDGSKFIIDYRLSDLESILDPALFFRLNRSFVAHFESIQSMVNVSKSRIKIELNPKAKREIIISSENSQDFKKWLNR